MVVVALVRNSKYLFFFSGFATSLLLAQRGAQVVFCARDAHPNWYTGAQAETIINSDPQVSIGKAKFLPCDITNRTSIRMVLNYIDTRYNGQLDAAINNAGIGGPLSLLHELDMDMYLHKEHDPIANNLYGTLNAMYEQVNFWIKKQDTKRTYAIVNLSSYNGLRACATCSLYAASKHGIIGLTQSIALEYVVATEKTPRIRVNAIAPGLIDTPLTRNQIKFVVNGTQPWLGPLITEEEFAPYKPQFEKELAGKKIGEAVQIANLVAFLASDEASYISGSVYSADNAQIAL